MIVDPDFMDHWKTRMLVGLLEADECAPLYVLRIWAHCQLRRQDTFDNLPVEALKALCRFPGNANKLESSLTASGFVRRDGRALHVCNWSEYNKTLIAAWNNGSKSRDKAAKNSAAPPTAPPTGPPMDPRLDRRGEDEIGEDGKRTAREPTAFALTEHGLAQEFVFYSTRIKNRSKADKEEDAVPIMADLLKLGIPASDIRAEIVAKQRLTTEYLWEFKKRLMDRHGKGNSSKTAQFSGVAAVAARHAADGTLHEEMG